MLNLQHISRRNYLVYIKGSNGRAFSSSCTERHKATIWCPVARNAVVASSMKNWRNRRNWGKTWSQLREILVISSFWRKILTIKSLLQKLPISNSTMEILRNVMLGLPSWRLHASGDNSVVSVHLTIRLQASRCVICSKNSRSIFGITWKNEEKWALTPNIYRQCRSERD